MANPSNGDLNRDVVQIIQNVLNTVNPYAAAYKNMAEVEAQERTRAAQQNIPPSVVTMRMLEGEDRRRYNAARHEEVAAIFIGEDGAPPVGREIVVYPRDQPLRQINHLSANVDPMSYPLLFPRGDAGWDTSLTHDDDRRTRERYQLTQLQYYAYRLAVS